MWSVRDIMVGYAEQPIAYKHQPGFSFLLSIGRHKVVFLNRYQARTQYLFGMSSMRKLRLPGSITNLGPHWPWSSKMQKHGNQKW